MEYGFKVKKKALFFIILAFSLVAIGITIAFFNAYYENQTNYYVSNYNITLEQDWSGNWGEQSVSIVNNGSTSVALRISYNEIWSKEVESEKIIINNISNDASVVTKEWTDTFLNNFIYNNGWYYYKKILTGNEAAQILNGIYLNKTAGSYDYDEYTYELSFNYETVQATEKAINSLWNQNITIIDNNIEWNF